MKVRCPVCRNWCVWEDNSFRPFCSAECRSEDLGNWATERYRVPEEEPSGGDPVEEETDGNDRKGNKD